MATKKLEKKKDFKDWFDRSAATALADQLTNIHPSFDKRAFVGAACEGLSSLEMMQRVGQFSDALRTYLPPSYQEAIGILIRSLPPPKHDCESLSDGWLQWPVGHFIAKNGLHHYDVSMHAMKELTMRFTSEFAVRPFAEAYPEKAYNDLLKLTQHKNPHVRRWCSEGSRPRLPWGKRLNQLILDPSPILPILDALREDPELYVRRSVANSLNEIAKDHPKTVVEICRRWKSEVPSAQMEQLVRHALRSLVKKGDANALELLGFSRPDQITAQLTLVEDEIKIGESISMQLKLTSGSQLAQKVVIDFAIHYKKKDGKCSDKVFKWTTRTITAESMLELTKRHAFRKTSVRALYPGLHKIEIQINGHKLGHTNFLLNS